MTITKNEIKELADELVKVKALISSLEENLVHLKEEQDHEAEVSQLRDLPDINEFASQEEANIERALYKLRHQEEDLGNQLNGY